jgi:hypothetical protein
MKDSLNTFPPFYLPAYHNYLMTTYKRPVSKTGLNIIKIKEDLYKKAVLKNNADITTKKPAGIPTGFYPKTV